MYYLLKLYTINLSQELNLPTKALHHVHISNVHVLEKNVFEVIKSGCTDILQCI